MIDNVGKYRILELIGRGGVGAVYKALDPLLKRVVAIKVIADTTAVTDELRARFFREARAAANLSHRNIVTVYDLGEDREQLFLVMEYLEGEELGRVIATGRELSVEVKLALMIQVCDALTYAHAKGVVHRDIKPANIFVLHDRTVKILDFGIARIATADEGLTQTGRIMGTLCYMSPEQARGRVDPRSDMFSAGAVFYELFTSRSPLAGSDPLSILAELSSIASPSLFRPDPAIPEDLATVIQRMLHKDPNARYGGMAEVRNALDGVRGRLRSEARELRSRLERLATVLGELEAAVTERLGFDVAPLAAPSPGEGTPVAALEKLEREYEERVARLRLLGERAHAVRLEYEQAMERLDAGEWAAALAGFERVVEDMPEHAGAREGLARARAEVRASEESAQREREAAERASHAVEDARSRTQAPDPAGSQVGSEADATHIVLSAAPVDQSHGNAWSQFATATAAHVEVAAGTPQGEQSGQHGEGPVARGPDETAGEPPILAGAETAIAATAERALPPAVAGPDLATEVAPDLTALEAAAAKGIEAIDPGSSSSPWTAMAPDGSSRESTGRRSEAGSSGVAASAAPHTSPWIRLRLLRTRTLALGSVALAMAVAVAWLAPSFTISRRLQAEVMQARQGADASRDEAMKVEAPVLARALFDAAATKDREGQQLAGARRFGPAVAHLREAAAGYTDAARAARAAWEVRDRADHARAQMLAAKKNAVPGTPEFREALAREKDGDDRYRQLAFADATDGFETAARLFAKALPPPATQASPAVTAGADAQDEIREVLRLYARAFETKDLALLQQVRPALRADELSRHRATFDQVRSYRLTLRVDTLTVRGEEAEAKGRREDVVVTGNGETVRYPGEFRFRLRRVNDRWRIDAVK